AMLALRHGWRRGIERMETRLIVRLQALQITRGMVHDGGDVLSPLVRMFEPKDMAQLVQDDAAHVEERSKLPMTQYRLERPIIGLPAELGIQDGRRARSQDSR